MQNDLPDLSSLPLLSYPVIRAGFELTNDKDLMSTLPAQISNGTYSLKSPYDLHIDCGKTRIVKTGVKLHIPDYIDVAPCEGVPEGVVPSMFPRMTLQVQVSSIFQLLVDHGIQIIGPSILSSTEANGNEIVLYVKNIGNKRHVVRKGESLAEIHFTCAPFMTLHLLPRNMNNE